MLSDVKSQDSPRALFLGNRAGDMLHVRTCGEELREGELKQWIDLQKHKIVENSALHFRC